jgi:alkyl hydroperoxide reductase subunit F
MVYDLIIIGGGPAGVSAGIYAARKQLKTLLVASELGGQSVVSENVENWIGTVKLTGRDLAKNLKTHLLAYAGDSLETKEGEKAENITKDGENFLVKTDQNEYRSRAVLVATGSVRRKLNIKGAEEFDNKGVTYCASCDGPLFAGQEVVVVGGGNSALESASQLLSYCKSVTLLDSEKTPRGEKITVDKLSQNPNFKIISNVELVEIKGNKFAESIVYKNKETGEISEIKTPGIFVEIGLIPATKFAENILKLTCGGQIPVDHKNQRTEVNGIWAAGDCTDGLYHQNNISAGDAVKALEDIYVWLKTR